LIFLLRTFPGMKMLAPLCLAPGRRGDHFPHRPRRFQKALPRVTAARRRGAGIFSLTQALDPSLQPGFSRSVGCECFFLPSRVLLPPPPLFLPDLMFSPYASPFFKIRARARSDWAGSREQESRTHFLEDFRHIPPFSLLFLKGAPRPQLRYRPCQVRSWIARFPP